MTDLNFFLNKKVVISQKDGFVQYGILTGFDDFLIFLKFNDGRVKGINKDEIKNIRIDNKGGSY